MKLGRFVNRRTVVGVAALVVVAAAGVGASMVYRDRSTTTVVAYFENTNGTFAGDNVKIMGVDVGKIDRIEPAGDRMKVTLRFDSKYDVPADAKAVIVSQSLISSRAIQLVGTYTGGTTLDDGAVIPLERTAVPVEWDDLRIQLEKLASAIGPSVEFPDGPLGGLVDDASQALAGNGESINTTLREMARAMDTLATGSDDMFTTIRNLQLFVSALSSSERQLASFNRDLASVTGALTDTDAELSTAMKGIDSITELVRDFVDEHRDGLETSVAHLTAVTTALDQSKPDLEQLLHVGPTAFANFYNIYQPAQGTLTGVVAVTQFQNPIQFICGAIQSAGRLGAEESARKCAEYLGPTLTSLEMNYPPVGWNAAAGVQVRPEQIDYSRDYLRPPAGMQDTDVPGVFTSAPPVQAIALGGLLGLSEGIR
ncbi:phospholipid/cholesterol/gamma-HCH transport system substrate-binding protein [Rhodococcus sp. 27YEA15]|uniref:MCE family protein n=1 Tax=Rhodococcus sp. 27YEA15 TaxID=3156259 RepID=UPI003C7E702A